MGERAETEGAQKRAGTEIAEHRIDAAPQHQRHDHARGPQHDQGVAVGGHMGSSDHKVLQFP